MNKNKHLLLWSSLGVAALLIAAAVDENLLKEWRQIQAAARTSEGPVEVRLRQIVIPELRATDRCVSCHLGMAPGASEMRGSRLMAAHPPVGHDPAQFGCTVCHGGQGRATDKADAHGDVHFWPSPLIPIEYASAGCGACHTHLRVTNVALMQVGRNLVERYDCLACHRIDGRGGTVRPGGAGGMEGPDLSHAGSSGFAPDWYQRHLKQSETAEAGAWKTSFGPIDEQHRQAIEGFLLARVGVPDLVEAKGLFHSLGCRGCHKVGGIGGDDGPDLTRFGEKDPHQLDFRHVPGAPTFANWLAEHFRHPAQVVSGSKMPVLGLAEDEIDKLILYVLSLRRSDFPDAFWPRDRVLVDRLDQREFATDGATLHGTFCAACHGPSGEGRRFPDTVPFPSIANADFLAAASDEFLTETIRRGRPGRRMPAWGQDEGGLRAEEISELVAHLRRIAGETRPASDASPLRFSAEAGASAGQRLFSAYCAGCHGPHGEGTDAPALNNTVFLKTATNRYLVETISRGRRGTDMPSFRDGSLTFPSLSQTEIESIASYMRTWEERAP